MEHCILINSAVVCDISLPGIEFLLLGLDLLAPDALQTNTKSP